MADSSTYPVQPVLKVVGGRNAEAAAMLRFESRAIGSVEGSRFCPGRKNFNHFEINGTRGSLAFNFERMNELELYVEDGPNSGFRTILATDESHPYVDAWWPPCHIIGYEHSFTHTIFDLVCAIDRGEFPDCNFRDGVHNQRLLEAIERSSTSGPPIASESDRRRGSKPELANR